VSWHPDWRGQDCAIIASGPSLTKADVLAVRGRARVIAVKRNADLAPWADCVYGCDTAWWRNSAGLPWYQGLKVCGTARGISDRFPDIRLVTVIGHVDELLFDEPGTIGSGGNSGFQALNLAAQWGAARILLLGFDAAGAGTQVHWYGRNNGMGQSNPDELNFRRWRQAFARAAEELGRRGVEVVNASTRSSLSFFPARPVPVTLDQWAA
jgi:hypothetical protein